MPQSNYLRKKEIKQQERKKEKILERKKMMIKRAGLVAGFDDMLVVLGSNGKGGYNSKLASVS